MKITRKQLRGWSACYTDERIAELVPEAGLAPLEIAVLDIPPEDRLWVLLREDVIPSRELRLLLCDWAECACKAAGWTDERSLAAISVARRYSVGSATDSELEAACAAACAAARSEAARLARSARQARSATDSELEAARSRLQSLSRSFSASRAAAWSAARLARSAAWAAARSASCSAARSAQLADVVRVLEKMEGGIEE